MTTQHVFGIVDLYSILNIVSFVNNVSHDSELQCKVYLVCQLCVIHIHFIFISYSYHVYHT